MSESAGLLADIRNQPPCWADLLEYQFGAGRSALTEAAAAVRQARHLVLSGMGSSHFACAALAHQLADQGTPAFLIDTAELLHYQHRAFGNDAVVVLVSRSGETVEAVKVLPLLRQRGARVIGVTNVAGSTLERQADHAVLIGSAPDHLGVAIQTYTSTLLCLHLLGAAVLGQPLDGACHARVMDVVHTTREAMDVMLQASEAWPAFLGEASTIHLLARGASMASAMEGAIVFNEIAKVAGLPMSASLFRHGPVEVVDRSFRAVIFAPPSRTRELDLALASDLTALGVAVRWIGPPDAANDPIASLRLPCPQVPAALAPVVEILPIQLAALRTAEARKVPIGQFRIAGSVTLEEKGFQTRGFKL